MSTEPSISVIIPVHNGGAKFRRCLLALSEAEPPPNEIIVVGDADSDGSAERAEASGARVIHTALQSGPAQARNMGARQALGDILFFVDADVLIPTDAIAQVAALFRREPDLAAAFGSYDDAPSAPNFLSQYRNLLHHYVHQTAAEEASTFWSGCGAIRRSIFLEMGGFDPNYSRPAIEDIELGYRLKTAGYHIRLYKALQVKHLKRWGIRSLLRADFYYRALPWTELILRDHRLINDLNLRTHSRISAALLAGLLGALMVVWWWPRLIWFASAAILLLLALNAPLYRFFWRKRGLWFMLRAIPWHWFYYFYSGLAFALGTARHCLGRRKASRPGVAGEQIAASRPEEGQDLA